MIESLEFFRVPEKIYFKKGCLPVALEELKYIRNFKKVLIIADAKSEKQGILGQATKKLHALGISFAVGCSGDSIRIFAPDCILAFGSDLTIMQAQKYWEDYSIPETGTKAYFVAVPCFVGSSAHVRNFVCRNAENPLFFADMAVIDTDLMSRDPDLILRHVRDAFWHAQNACESEHATDYSDSMAIQAIRIIFQYLPEILRNPDQDHALEKLASAGTMAGIAFTNSRAEFSTDFGNCRRCPVLLGMDSDTFRLQFEKMIIASES